MNYLAALLLACAVAAPAASQACNLPTCHNLGSGSFSDGNGGPFLTGHTYILKIAAVPAGLALDFQAIVLPDARPMGSLTEIFRGRFHY